MNLNTRISLYGFINTIFDIILYLLRPILKINSFIVVSCKESTKLDESVNLMTNENIENWFNDKQIDKEDFDKFILFLNSNCIGHYIEVDDNLAGYGFSQMSGEYNYGGNYVYNLQDGYYILKNLFIKPEFRQNGLGLKINKARININKKSMIALVFVIPKNKYAIKNLKKVGFRENILVHEILWFKKIHQRVIKVINSGDITTDIVKGFN